MPLKRWLDRLRVLQETGAPLSRNSAFDLFADQANLQALRHLRRLKSLGRQMRRSPGLFVTDAGEGLLRVIMTDRRVRLRHTVYLTSDEATWLADQDRTLARYFGDQ
jgi:hypothetical protein